MMKTESSKSIAECANRDRLSSPNCDHVSFFPWIHGSSRTSQRPWFPGLNEAIMSDPEFAFDILPPNKTTWSGKLTTP